jgi:DNA-binding transcriptional regulator GbsR (MarR family)
MLEISEVIFESNDPQELQETRQNLITLRDELKKTVNDQFAKQQFKELKPNLAKLNVLCKKLFTLEERLTHNPELQKEI